MTNTEWRKRRHELRHLYTHGWDILCVWAQCRCLEGTCPLEGELVRLGVTPGGLLLALVLGDADLMTKP